MSNGDSWQRGARPPGQSGVPKRRSLLPSGPPLTAWKAVGQVAILLGIPITLLLIARIILRVYFPHLGY